MSKIESDDFGSLTNFLKYNREDHVRRLSDLFDVLCLNRYLSPSKTDDGLTLLLPDKTLVDELYTIFKGGSGSTQVASLLKSLIIPAPIDKLDKFASIKNIPTVTGKKLPDGGKVVKGELELANGSKLSICESFKTIRVDEARKDIAVYILSEKLIPTDTEAVERKLQIKEIKGNTSSSEKENNSIFTTVFNKFVQARKKESGRDPALEVLVNLYQGSDEEAKQQLALNFSWDTMTTLHIIMKKGLFDKNKLQSNGSGHYLRNTLNPVKIYRDAMNSVKKSVEAESIKRAELQKKLSDTLDAANVQEYTEKLYKTITVNKVENGQDDDYAYAACRILAALAQTNALEPVDAFTLKNIYNGVHNNVLKKSKGKDLPSYVFCVKFMAVVSDGLCYVPGLGSLIKGVSIHNLSSPQDTVCLDMHLSDRTTTLQYYGELNEEASKVE
jgi:hypothetical protein